MPVKHKPGKVIRGYRIKQFLNSGGLAISYQAEKGGRKFFFKQYKSPAPASDWFDGYVAYATEIKRRIQADDAARTRCYEMVEFFVEKDFFQVFEFVEGGMSLTDVVGSLDKFDWNTRVTFAKVMMSGIAALHEVGVVHTDLKPDNIYLLPDPSIGVGYRLRVIDLDFAILADKQAPWLGSMGYIGTDNYRSPEHMRGQTPVSASDVFTCGIMLSQILCASHPHAADPQGAEAAALAGRATPFHIPEPIKRVNDVPFLAGVLNSCLCPEPARRPTAKQVADALLGKTFTWEAWVPAASAPDTTIPRPAPAPHPSTPAAAATGVKIFYGPAEVLTVRVKSALGKSHFLKVHPDAQFLSNPQFHICQEDGCWTIAHDPAATNATLVDGRPLATPLPVMDGMVVSVGNPAKGISKFPLTLRLLP